MNRTRRALLVACGAMDVFCMHCMYSNAYDVWTLQTLHLANSIKRTSQITNGEFSEICLFFLRNASGLIFETPKIRLIRHKIYN